ncbi:MAG: lipopolysaccharide transport system permease protein [Alphaproteobacteria bacterium]|jgi:lipopolysaccharide transport system permease protein|nr:lipopolysaccharide transport system permease protein [Alphaproteobacteria bacterium]
MKLVIEPGATAKHYWRDLWHYRELLYFLAWRDVAVRYKQTAIGIAWALIRPALTMLVFVGFRRLLGLPSGAVPDPIFVFAAVLPWQFFSSALSESANSLISNANLVSKIYFPRLVIPCAAIITSLVDFCITLVLLAILMLWYGFVPGWQLIALPIFILLAFGLALGSGLLLAALNVEYRDFRHIMPFIVQFGLFISPIAFSTADVPEQWRTAFALNPLVGIIEGFRWSLLGGRVPLPADAVAISITVTTFMLVAGIWYFRRMEHNFADVI